MAASSAARTRAPTAPRSDSDGGHLTDRLRTSLSGLLDLEYPILQSGMGGVAGPEPVAEVSRAGGLGLLAGLRPSADQIRKGIRRVQGALNAFGAELGIPSATGRPGPVPDVVDEAVEVILEEREPVRSIGLGNPGRDMVARCRERGVKAISRVATVDDARAVADSGVDASDATMVTDAFTGLYARTLRSAFTDGYAASGAPVLPALLQSSAAQDIYAAASQQENREYFPMCAGQSVGLIHDLPSAAEVAETLAREARAALRALGERVQLG